jgi:hypothetical protein
MSAKTPQRQVWYIHALRDTRYAAAGHWFYDPGSDVQCAHARWERHSRFDLYIDAELQGKPALRGPMSFRSMAECKAYVAKYFGCRVIQVAPSALPSLTDD